MDDNLNEDDAQLTALLASIEHLINEANELEAHGPRLGRLEFVRAFAQSLQREQHHCHSFDEMIRFINLLLDEVDDNSHVVLFVLRALQAKVRVAFAHALHPRQSQWAQHSAESDLEKVKGCLDVSTRALEGSREIESPLFAVAAFGLMDHLMEIERAPDMESIQANNAAGQAKSLQEIITRVVKLTSFARALIQFRSSTDLSEKAIARVEFVAAFAGAISYDSPHFDSFLSIAWALYHRLDSTHGPSWYAVKILWEEAEATIESARQRKLAVTQGRFDTVRALETVLTTLESKGSPNDARLIGPMFKLTAKLRALQDNDRDGLSSFDGVDDAHIEVKELQKAAEVAEQFPALPPTTHTAHSIGRRTAQRLGINRARFIAQANA